MVRPVRKLSFSYDMMGSKGTDKKEHMPHIKKAHGIVSVKSTFKLTQRHFLAMPNTLFTNELHGTFIISFYRTILL